MRLQHGLFSDRCMLSVMKQPHLPVAFVHTSAFIVAKWIYTLACQSAVGQQAPACPSNADPGPSKSLGSYAGRYEPTERTGGAYVITATQRHTDLTFPYDTTNGVHYVCSAWAVGGWGVHQADCCDCFASGDPTAASRSHMWGNNGWGDGYACYYGCHICDASTTTTTSTQIATGTHCQHHYSQDNGRIPASQYAVGTSGCKGANECQFLTLELAKGFCDGELSCTAVLQHPGSANCASGLGCFIPRQGPLSTNSSWQAAGGSTLIKGACKVASSTTSTNQAAMCGNVTPSLCLSTWSDNYFGIELTTYQQSKQLFVIGSTIVAGGVTYYVDAIQQHHNCNSNVGLVYVANRKECADGTPWVNTAQCGHGGKITTPLTTGDRWCLYSSTTTAQVTTITTTTTLSLSLRRAQGTGSTTTATFSASTAPPIRHIQGQLGMMVSDAVDFVREANLTLVLRQGVAEVAEVPDDWVTILSVKLDSIDVDIGKRRLSATQELDVSWKIFIDPAAPEQLTAVIIRDRYARKTVNEVTQAINNIIAAHSNVLGANYIAKVTWKIVDAWSTPTPDPDLSPTSDSGGGNVVWIIIFAILLCFALVGFTVLCCLNKILNARKHEPHVPSRPSTQKKFEQVAGKAAKCDFTELLKPPECISRSDGEGILRLARAMVPPKGRSSELYLAFAMGHRPQDAEGFGPGMYYATAVLKYLHDHGVDCFCGLMFQHGIDNHDAFLAQLASPTSCKVLIVIQTKALYEVFSSLEQLYVAQERGVEFLPLRFERDLPSAKDEWLNVSSADPLFSLAMLPVMLPNVRRKISAATSMPPPPHTVVDVPGVLHDVSAHLRLMLGSEYGRVSGTECQPSSFAKSSTEVEAMVGRPCVKPTTLGRSSWGACSSDRQGIEQTASVACADRSKANGNDIVADKRNQGLSIELDKAATSTERKRTRRKHSKQIASMQQGCASRNGFVGADSRAPTSKHKPHVAPKSEQLIRRIRVLRPDESLNGPMDAQHQFSSATLHTGKTNRGQLGRPKRDHKRKEKQAAQFANSTIDASKSQPAHAITATRDCVDAIDHLAGASKNKRRDPSGDDTDVSQSLSASVVRDKSFDGATSEPSSQRRGHNRRPQHGGVRKKKRNHKTPHSAGGNQHERIQLVLSC